MYVIFIKSYVTRSNHIQLFIYSLVLKVIFHIHAMFQILYNIHHQVLCYDKMLTKAFGQYLTALTTLTIKKP